MTRTNRGQIFEIIDGVNKGKQCIAYYGDQTKQFQNAGKVCIRLIDPLTDKESKILIEPKFLKRIGFID